MTRLRILITNNTLAKRAGSELYVRDLAIALLDRGHAPIAYSSILGDVAQELRMATVPVINDLDVLVEPPDVIHGHHHLDTMAALLRFPDVPAVSFCHGWLPWEEIPPRFPRILRYVAVDQACLDRLIFEHGISPDCAQILPNFVDLKRFKARGPLPARPQRALIFSNQANEYTQIPAVREACAHFNIHVDVIGLSAGNPCVRPEEVLGDYDIVFAKARAALEALAVGAAVILCDASGVGPMVTTKNMEHLRLLNFGIRTLRNQVKADAIAEELTHYAPLDAQHVSRRIRATAGLDKAVEELILIYRQVISEYKRSPGPDVIAEAHSASAYLRMLTPRLKERDQAAELLDPQLLESKQESQNYQAVVEKEGGATGTQEDVIGSLRRQLADAVKQNESLRGQLEERMHSIQTLSAELTVKKVQLEKITNSLGWRMLKHYGPLKHRFVLPAYNRVAGLFRSGVKSGLKDP